MRAAKRVERSVSAQEWAEALAWARQQRVTKDLGSCRSDVVARFWIELRTPVVATGDQPSREEERARAWMRACKAIRKEREGEYDVPPIPRGYAYRADKDPEGIRKRLA
jgi:hypothetical protein